MIMREIQRKERPCRIVLVAVLLVAPLTFAIAENVDPDNDDSQYAFGENIGWVNAEPLGDGGSGLEVGDDEVAGWLWTENAGWISLSCQNTSSCGNVSYGVTNDGKGNLSGFAWGENIGWVNFRTSAGSDCCLATRTPGCTDPACEAVICTADPYCCNNNWDQICADAAAAEPACSLGCADDPFGVRIHGFSGVFSGQAWSENAGWINFGSPAPESWQVETGWSCPDPDSDGVCSASDNCPTAANTNQGTAPFGQTVRALDKFNFAWPSPADYQLATGTFVVSADIGTYAIDFCQLGSGTTYNDTLPGAGLGYWYLFRPDCGVGSYSTGSPSEVTDRDAGVICP